MKTYIIPHKKVIARSSVECIDQLLREFKGLGSGGYLTFGKVKGEYVKEQITKEDIANNCKRHEKLLKWIGGNCDILPCNEALEMNASRKEQLDETLGKDSVDSILIAKEKDYLLLADEKGLRDLAYNDFQVKGLPIYSIFRHCIKENYIEQEVFDNEISKLIGFNYKFLPVNGEILMKCADTAEFKNAFPFDLAIKTLDVSISSEDSSILVATDFFYKLFASNLLPNIRLNLIIPTLNVLANRGNFIIVIKKLIVMIGIKFRFLPLQKDELISIISTFINANR